MVKEKGKLYEHNGVVIMVTENDHGTDLNSKRFSGTVIESKNSEFPIGTHSNTWPWHEDVFREYNRTVSINNRNWKE